MAYTAPDLDQIIRHIDVADAQVCRVLRRASGQLTFGVSLGLILLAEA
jgi:hypothetical protein